MRHLFFGATICALGACSSVTLHNEGREKAATAALEAVKEIDFKAYGQARAARLDQLRAQQVDITDDVVQINADINMRNILTKPANEELLPGFGPTADPHEEGVIEITKCKKKGIVAKRLCLLGVIDTGDRAATKAAFKFGLATNGLMTHIPRENLRAFLGALTPRCEDLSFLQSDERRKALRETLIASLSEKKRGEAKQAYDDYANECQTQVTAFDDFARRMIEKATKTPTPDLQKACDNGLTIETELSTALCALWKADKKIVAAKASIAAVAAELKAASKRLSDASPDGFDEAGFDKALGLAKEKVDKIVSGAEDALSAIGKDGGSALAALDGVSAMLTAATTGEAGIKEDDEQRAKRAKTLFAAFPSLAKKFGVLAGSLAKPAPAELEIAKGYLEIKRETLVQELLLLEARRALELRTLRAGMAQAYILQAIEIERADMCPPPSSCTKTPLELLRSDKDEVRQSTYTALSQAWIALTEFESIRKQAVLVRNDLRHREINIQRNRVLAEARFLAAGGVEELAAFHKTGLKPDEIASVVGRLTNLAILGGILNETD